ncbi:MAG: beta-ketoacyl-ACP synthase III [Eubacteriaceae bacterium]
MSLSIIGIGSALPKTIQTNNDLTQYLDTSDEWICSRTGIESRHICVDETLLDIATVASIKAIKDAKISPEDIDLIIAPTLGGDTITPSLASLLQEKIGAKCPAFDVNAACSGFIYGLDIAEAYLHKEHYNNILVIAVDAMSKLVDWNDRSTAVLFGDGAGAVVISKGNNLKSILITSQGNAQPLSIPWNKGNHPLLNVNKHNEKPYLKMEGADVYRFAVSAICEDLKKVTKDANLTLEDLDLIIPHQANLRIIEGASKRLKIPMEKFAITLNYQGNTSAPSIPLALDHYYRQGLLKPGMLLGLTAFGGGLTTGACVISW